MALKGDEINAKIKSYHDSICGKAIATVNRSELVTYLNRLNNKYPQDFLEQKTILQSYISQDEKLETSHLSLIAELITARDEYIRTMFTGTKNYKQEQTDYEAYVKTEDNARRTKTRTILKDPCVDLARNVTDITGKWMAPFDASIRLNYYQVFKDTDEILHNSWKVAQNNAEKAVNEKNSNYFKNKSYIDEIVTLFPSWSETQTSITHTLSEFSPELQFSNMDRVIKNIETHIQTHKDFALSKKLSAAITNLLLISTSERDIDMEKQIKKYQPLCAAIKEFFDDSLLKMQQISCAYKLLTNEKKAEPCTDLPEGMPECIVDSILTKIGGGVSANDLLIVYDIYLILAKITNNATLLDMSGESLIERFKNFSTRLIVAAGDLVFERIPREIQQLFDVIPHATPKKINDAKTKLHRHVASKCTPETQNTYCNALAYAYYMSVQSKIHDKLILPAQALVKEITSYVTSHSQAIKKLELEPILAEPAKYDATQINNAILVDQRTYIGYITTSINAKKSRASDELKSRLQAALSANAVPEGISAFSENKKIIETLLSFEKELDLENAQRAKADECKLGYIQASEELTLAIDALSASTTMQDVKKFLAAAETLRTSVLTMRASCTKQNVNLEIYDKNNDDVITNASEASRIYSAVSLESLNDTDREILKASLKELESSFNDNILFDVLCRELLEERFKSFLSRRLKPTEVDYWETDFKADLTNGKPVNSFVNLIITEKYGSLKKDKDKISLAQDVAKIVSSAGADCKDNATLKDVTKKLIKRDAELNGPFKEVLQKQLSNLDISVQRCIEAFATTHAFLLAKDGTLKPDTDLVSLGDKLQGFVKACDADKNMPVEITATLKPALSALLERYNDKSPETIACSLQALLSEMKSATEAAKIIALQIYYETPGVEGDKALQAIEIWPHIDTLVSTNLSCKDGKPANAFVTYRLRDRFSENELKKIEGVTNRMHDFDNFIKNATENIGENLVMEDIPSILMTLANSLRSAYSTKNTEIEEKLKAEAERVRKEQADKEAAEAERERKENEDIAAAEAERVRKENEDIAAAQAKEAERVRKEDEDIAAAQAKEAERVRKEQSDKAAADARAEAAKKAAKDAVARAEDAAVYKLTTHSNNKEVNEAAIKKFDEELEKSTAAITAAIAADKVQFTIYEAIDTNPSPVIITQFHASIPDDLYAPDFKNPSLIWYKRFARTWSSNILNWRKSKGLEYYQGIRNELDAKYVTARQKKADTLDALKTTQGGGSDDDAAMLASLITHVNNTTNVDESVYVTRMDTTNKYNGPNERLKIPLWKIPLSQQNASASYNKYYQEAISDVLWMIKIDIVIITDEGDVEWIPWQVMSDFFKAFPLTKWHTINNQIPTLSPKQAWKNRLVCRFSPQSSMHLLLQSNADKSTFYNDFDNIHKNLFQKHSNVSTDNAGKFTLTSECVKLVAYTKGATVPPPTTEFKQSIDKYNDNLVKFFKAGLQPELLEAMKIIIESIINQIDDTTRFTEAMFALKCCNFLQEQSEIRKALQNFIDYRQNSVAIEKSLQTVVMTAWLDATTITSTPTQAAISKLHGAMKDDPLNAEKINTLYSKVTAAATNNLYSYPKVSKTPWSIPVFIRIKEAAWALGKQKEFYSEFVVNVLRALESTTPDTQLNDLLNAEIFVPPFDPETKAAINAVITAYFENKPMQKWTDAIGEFMQKLVVASELKPVVGVFGGLFTSKSDGDKLIETIQDMKSAKVNAYDSLDYPKDLSSKIAAFWPLHDAIIDDLKKQVDNWKLWKNAISVSKEWSVKSQNKWLKIFDANYMSDAQVSPSVDNTDVKGIFFNTAYKLIADIDDTFKESVIKKSSRIKYTDGKNAVPLLWSESQLNTFSKISLWLNENEISNDKSYIAMSKLTQSGKPAVVLWKELKEYYKKLPTSLHKACFYTIWMNLLGNRAMRKIADEILNANTVKANTALLKEITTYHNFLNKDLYDIAWMYVVNHPILSWTIDTYIRVKTIVELLPVNVNPKSDDVNEPFAAVKEWETKHPPKSVTMTNIPQPINNNVSVSTRV